MGSLNGDVMVMRNGRTTSQVSVYNYPEHLNPFYEDEQHKRLRFWKIHKKDNEGRRNSFSIGNLKDMWAFKSFRLKKKSSTLGINKTSESPPTLRRDYVIDNGYNTFDHRLRGNNTSSINGDSFQRNATYRSSLQSLPTSNDRMGLNRNDGYRSTIQVTRSYPRYQTQQKSLQQQQQQQRSSTGVSQNNRRYVYGGSVTPQPLRNNRTDTGTSLYEYDCNNVMLIRRSSQSSMVSTNPFESDDDYEDINTSNMSSVNGGSTTTLTSRTQRKKRRAPAPPTPIHGNNNNNGVPPPIIHRESSHDGNQDELRIEEDIDIANLTAEIESFVKTKDNDEVEVLAKEDHTIKTPDITTKSMKTFSISEEEIERKADIKESEPIPKDDNITTITNISTPSAVVSDISMKEKTVAKPKAKDQVTTEIITVTTTTTTTKKENDNKCSQPETNVAQVSKEILTKSDEGKQIKSNGAIPKKTTNNTVTITFVDHQQQSQPNNKTNDLCIKETQKEELNEKPVPLKRQSKREAEVGQVECIHVHVESPRTAPRSEHGSGVSSFKASETVETKEAAITNKTPFVLTSPPMQRRKVQLKEAERITKETVKLVESNPENERINELTIKEESTATKPVKPEKPALSPKPVTKEQNGKVQGFAEIHKPIRKFTNIQNGQVRRASREEIITTPIIPLKNHTKEEENKINHSIVNQTSQKVNVATKQEETQTLGKLKIIESVNTTSSDNSDLATPLEKEQINDKKVKMESSVSTTSTSVPSVTIANDKQKQDDEFELLYRPKPANQMEWKQSTLAPLETHIPPEKRKSVKDIIESINRSQRLLNAAANKDFPALQTQTITTTTSNSSSNNTAPESITLQQASQTQNNKGHNLNENLKFLEEKQDEIQRLVNEMYPSSSNNIEAEVTNEAANSPPCLTSNGNNEHGEHNQKLDNGEIFQKCKVKKEVYDYRESSPISSNLDWNPVPKPKRTKPGQE